MVARNYERVLTARLRDARFFWDADRKVPLEERIERLRTIRFHKKLGSYFEKSQRIETLARWIAAEPLESAAVAEWRPRQPAGSRRPISRPRWWPS